MARWKEEPEAFWLKDAPSQSLQQSLKNLENAWTGAGENFAGN